MHIQITVYIHLYTPIHIHVYILINATFTCFSFSGECSTKAKLTPVSALLSRPSKERPYLGFHVYGFKAPFKGTLIKGFGFLLG